MKIVSLLSSPIGAPSVRNLRISHYVTEGGRTIFDHCIIAYAAPTQSTWKIRVYFMSLLFAEIRLLFEIEHLETTTCSPQANGHIRRYNQTGIAI